MSGELQGLSSPPSSEVTLQELPQLWWHLLTSLPKWLCADGTSSKAAYSRDCHPLLTHGPDVGKGDGIQNQITKYLKLMN